MLHRPLYTPAHSLIDQSLHSELGAEGTNGDGFGVGWYDDQPEPGVFRNVEPPGTTPTCVSSPATSNPTCSSLTSRAAIGSAVQQTDCHPCRRGRWLFMHNGFIGDYLRVKRDLTLAVDESLALRFT